MCILYPNLFCVQSCGCCCNCEKIDSCNFVCGIHKENRKRLKEKNLLEKDKEVNFK